METLYQPLTTCLTYLDDPSTLELFSSVEEIILNDSNVKIRTASTPFYAQADGQPGDVGVIENQNGKIVVHNVKYFNDSQVCHIGTMTKGSFVVGDIVNLKINEKSRLLNSAYHTAGELIISALKILRFDYPVLNAIHFGPSKSRITISVELESDVAQILHEQLQRKLNSMVFRGGEVEILNLTNKQDILANLGYLPISTNDNPVRVVKTWPATTGRLCMGTHIRDIKQLNKIDIERIEVRRGKTAIDYFVNYSFN